MSLSIFTLIGKIPSRFLSEALGRGRAFRHIKQQLTKQRVCCVLTFTLHDCCCAVKGGRVCVGYDLALGGNQTGPYKRQSVEKINHSMRNTWKPIT